MESVRMGWWCGVFRLFLILLSCAATADSVTLTILNTSDTHGALSPGWRQLAGEIRQWRKKVAPEACLLIDCGDTLQGSYEAAQDGGAAMVAILNELQYDVWVPGNHDFEFGIDNFRQRAAEFRGQMPAANLKLAGWPGCQVAWLERSGVKIGVIGLTEPAIADRLWQPQRQLEILDTFTAAAQALREAAAGGAEIIIAACHFGEYGRPFGCRDLLRQFPGIDLVLAGHTHQIVPGVAMYGSWFVQSGSHAAQLAVVQLEFDRQTRQVGRIVSRIVEIAPEQSSGARLQGSENEAEWDVSPPSAKNPELQMAQLAAEAMRSAGGTDLAIYGYYGNVTAIARQWSPRDLYEYYPFQDRIVVLNLSRTQLTSLKHELAEMTAQRRYYTAAISGEEHLPPDREPVSLAVTSYFAAGAGGLLPLLRDAAGACHDPAAPAPLVREAIAAYLTARQGRWSAGIPLKEAPATD